MPARTARCYTQPQERRSAQPNRCVWPGSGFAACVRPHSLLYGTPDQRVACVVHILVTHFAGDAHMQHTRHRLLAVGGCPHLTTARP